MDEEKQLTLLQQLLQGQQRVLQGQQHMHEQQQQLLQGQQQQTHSLQQMLDEQQRVQPSEHLQQQLLQQQRHLRDQLHLQQQLHDRQPVPEEVEGEQQMHLQQRLQQQQSMGNLLKHVQMLHNHMQLQQQLLEQRQDVEPSFRIHIYQITSMILGHVSTAYVGMIGIMVALSIFNQHWKIILFSTVLLLYSAVVCYGLLYYYYRATEDPAIQNRYVRLLRSSSYLTAIVSPTLLVGDILFTDNSTENYNLLIFRVVVGVVSFLCFLLSWWFY